MKAFICESLWLALYVLSDPMTMLNMMVMMMVGRGKSGLDEKWGEMIRSDDSRTQKNELYASPAAAYILTPTI